jgi:hypothetical protein
METEEGAGDGQADGSAVLTILRFQPTTEHTENRYTCPAVNYPATMSPVDPTCIYRAGLLSCPRKAVALGFCVFHCPKPSTEEMGTYSKEDQISLREAELEFDFAFDSLWQRSEDDAEVTTLDFRGFRIRGINQNVFWNRTIKKKLDLSGAVFTEEVHFFNVTFSEEATFANAVFKGIADFRSSRFIGKGDFYGAQFLNTAQLAEPPSRSRRRSGGLLCSLAAGPNSQIPDV